MTQKSIENANPTVCLDSSEVKRLRETQQLTQLYVSKVVGVTTDTISRWENNRYPTIRRENAIRLAEALEVPLEAILQKPAVEEPLTTEVPEKRPHLLFLWSLILLVVVVIAVLALTGKNPQLPPPVTAQRLLPDYAAPDTAIPVQVKLTQRAEGSGFILREYFPKGWKLLQASPPASSLDNINGVARWIIKAGDQRDRIVYLVQVERSVKGGEQGQFQGEVIAGVEGSQAAVAVQGEDRVKVAGVHWADTDGNGRIDDAEMLQASYTVAEMEGVLIDWNELERLWDAGSYEWDLKKEKFVPVRKLPAAGRPE